MTLAVVLEQRFDRTPDGAVWTADAFSRGFWDRFLDVFDQIVVVARVHDVPAVPERRRRVDGDGVRVHPVPHYIGPVAYLRQRRAVRRAVADSLDAADAVLLRAPGTLASLGAAHLRRRRRPYGLQVVGDPDDVFRRGATDHPLRAYFRHRFVRALRRECREAAATAYVTLATLQHKYPPGPATWTTSYSDVELDEAALVTAPPRLRTEEPYTIVTVGSLDQPYKAIDVLIEALARLRRAGRDVRLRVVGKGRLLPDLQALTARLGLTDAVVWEGSLPGATAVRRVLDEADVFALVSRTEGLPRALVEAMARGLPCVGSNAGGIPELLPPGARVPADDANALAALLGDVLDDPARREQMAATALAVAREYSLDVLHERRQSFFEAIRVRSLAP